MKKAPEIVGANAEEGTWTLTSVALTRTWILLVCQFRHFRITNDIIQQFDANVKYFYNVFKIKLSVDSNIGVFQSIIYLNI